MLVLARMENERLVIDKGRITITVISIRRHHGGLKVRLGIEAPPDCVVDREEVHKDRLARAAAEGEVKTTEEPPP